MDSNSKVREKTLGDALDDIIGDTKSFDELYFQKPSPGPFWVITKVNGSRCKKRK